MDDEDERALIQSWVEDRSEAAAGALIDRLHPRIAGIIARHYDLPEEFEDLEQEVFLNIFKHLPRYRPDRPLEHWISRIALNVCRQRWRRRSRRPELRRSDLSEAEQRVFDEVADDSDFTLDHSASEEARTILLKLFNHLNEGDRVVLSLLYLDEKSIAEVASILGKNETAVRVQSHRARKKLEKIASTIKNM